MASTRIRITKITGGDDIARDLEPKMRNLGNAIGRRAQRLVPKRTWQLHDTIVTGTERRGAKVVTEVGVGGPANGKRADYWNNVERGTSRMKAQPYLRPALLQSRAADLGSAVTMAAPRGGGGRDAAKGPR